MIPRPTNVFAGGNTLGNTTIHMDDWQSKSSMLANLAFLGYKDLQRHLDQNLRPCGDGGLVPTIMRPNIPVELDA